VEMTQGQVEEMEDEFRRVHKNIEDLFDKVDRATNFEATNARISARYVQTANLVQDVVHRTYSNPTSTCEVCIHPALCLKCGIRGEPSIFLCLGCRLPVPKDLRSCEACGNPCLCDNFCMIYETRSLGYTFCASTMGGSFSLIATGAGTERESRGLAAAAAK
jgi:hypothetical protein